MNDRTTPENPLVFAPFCNPQTRTTVRNKFLKKIYLETA